MCFILLLFVVYFLMILTIFYMRTLQKKKQKKKSSRTEMLSISKLYGIFLLFLKFKNIQFLLFDDFALYTLNRFSSFFLNVLLLYAGLVSKFSKFHYPEHKYICLFKRPVVLFLFLSKERDFYEGEKEDV